MRYGHWIWVVNQAVQMVKKGKADFMPYNGSLLFSLLLARTRPGVNLIVSYAMFRSGASV